MPASVMTMPEALKARQMHEQGLSQVQIAAALGRSRKAVRTMFRQLDIQPRSSAEGYRTWLQSRGGKGTKAKGAELAAQGALDSSLPTVNPAKTIDGHIRKNGPHDLPARQ